MRRILLLYKNAYGGLSRAAWLLAFIMFINRSGSMVTPFLTLYLTEDLHFDLSKAGVLVAIYGLGAMAGSFFGGWLTDKIGHFRVQLGSLFLGGSLFFCVLFLKSFWALAAGLAILNMVTETLRPANISSVSHYARPENVTRAFSLNRMAVNLGFSIGPALGGILAGLAFHWLFVADGITCIMAGGVFYFFFRNRKGHAVRHTADDASVYIRKPHNDVLFILFFLLTCSFAVMFFQLFTTLTLYYENVYLLSKAGAGLLLTINGLIVFLLEMIVVYLIGNKVRLSLLITGGVLLTGLAYVMLNLFHSIFMLYLSMFVLSLAEIFAMPFMATVSVKRSSPQSRGKYMGLYSFAYATAFVIAPLAGTTLVDRFGFDVLWWSVGGFSILVAAGCYFVVARMEKEIIAEEEIASKPVVAT